MSIAEELIDFRMSSNRVITRPAAIAAINEALELAAQEAEKDDGTAPAGTNLWPGERIAATIRALKSPAGPVQPSQKQEKSGA